MRLYQGDTQNEKKKSEKRRRKKEVRNVLAWKFQHQNSPTNADQKYDIFTDCPNI